MRSSRSLLWPLLLLVVLPSGVLAWLGLRGVRALDGERLASLRQERKRVQDELVAMTPALLAQVDADVRAHLEPAARDLEARLPGRDPTGQVQALRAAAEAISAGPIRVERIELVAAGGQPLLPVPHVEQARVASPGDMTLASLVDHLARLSDRAYYGEGGEAAALAVWQEAEDAATSDVLRRRLAVEAARVKARAGLEAAVEAAAALEGRWSRASLLQVGRPVMLLWLATLGGQAPFDSTHARLEGLDPMQRVAGRLAWLQQSGAIDAVPLTQVERARFHALWRARHRRDAVLTPATRALTVPIAGGAALRFHVQRSALRFALLQRLGPWSRQVPEKRLRTEAHDPIHPPRAPAWAAPFEEAASWQARLPLPGGGETVVEVALGRAALDAARESRDWRRWTYAGIALLLLVTVGGALFLLRAVRREREARRIRDDFIANVTHEVRTPLTSVLLHSELLVDEGEDDAKRREHAAVVQAQGQRLAALVGDMLDFAALERGTRTLEGAPVDLAAACRDALAPYRVLAEREGVEVTLDVPAGEVEALADPAALARILGNLVGNAWKHGRPSRDGQAGRITVAASSDGDGGVIDVRDDGPGIPASERTRIFERFGRGRASHAREGSGIGLSLSRDLARAMHGDLTVHEAGGATIFRLRLPPVPELDLESA